MHFRVISPPDLRGKLDHSSSFRLTVLVASANPWYFILLKSHILITSSVMFRGAKATDIMWNFLLGIQIYVKFKLTFFMPSASGFFFSTNWLCIFSFMCYQWEWWMVITFQDILKHLLICGARPRGKKGLLTSCGWGVHRVRNTQNATHHLGIDSRWVRWARGGAATNNYHGIFATLAWLSTCTLEDIQSS